MVQTCSKKSHQEKERHDEYHLEERGSYRSSRNQSRRENPWDKNLGVYQDHIDNDLNDVIQHLTQLRIPQYSSHTHNIPLDFEYLRKDEQ